MRVKKNGISIDIGSLLIFMLVLTVSGFVQVFSQDTLQKPFRIMFYNVENLFDTFNDTVTDDDDFLPVGVMRWNETRYHNKINALYKTIIAAGEWSPPEIIALCEIENRRVLDDVIYGTYLSRQNYGIIHQESPDRRGIDVCIIYRKDLLRIIDYRYWVPSGFRREKFTSRSILYAKIVSNSDTLHIIVNHWPSKRGGVLAGEDLRRNIASMLREKADSICKATRTGAKIIILGDFNSTPFDQDMNLLTDTSLTDNILINLSLRQAEAGIGSYRFMGNWEMIDQVIVSEKLISCQNGFCTGSGMFSVFRPGFLLTKDPKYPGSSPFATYRGYKYQGGFSDHLPVLLKLNLRHLPQQE